MRGICFGLAFLFALAAITAHDAAEVQFQPAPVTAR